MYVGTDSVPTFTLSTTGRVKLDAHIATHGAELQAYCQKVFKENLLV